MLLADDHSLVRRGFRRMLEDDPRSSWSAKRSDGDGSDSPGRRSSGRSVIVMDCAMPGTNGLVATQRDSRADRRTIAILMLSMHAEETLVRQAMDAGARGYILKNALDLDLAAAVKRVAAGETVLDPSVSTAPAALKGERSTA